MKFSMTGQEKSDLFIQVAAFTGLTVTVKDAYKRQTPVLVIFVKMNSLKYDSEMNYSRIIENNLETNVNGFFFQLNQKLFSIDQLFMKFVMESLNINND